MSLTESNWKPKEDEFYTHQKTKEIVRVEAVGRSDWDATEYIYVVATTNVRKRWRTSLATFRKSYRLTHPSELKMLADKPPPL